MGEWWIVRGLLGGTAIGYACCLMLSPGSSMQAMTFVGTAAALGLFIGFGFSCLKQHLRRPGKSSSAKRSAWWLMRGLLGGVLAGVAVAYYRSAPAIPSRVLLSLNVLVFVFVGLFLGWCTDVGLAILRNRKSSRPAGGD